MKPEDKRVVEEHIRWHEIDGQQEVADALTSLLAECDEYDWHKTFCMDKQIAHVHHSTKEIDRLRAELSTARKSRNHYMSELNSVHCEVLELKAELSQAEGEIERLHKYIVKQRLEGV